MLIFEICLSYGRFFSKTFLFLAPSLKISVETFSHAFPSNSPLFCPFSVMTVVSVKRGRTRCKVSFFSFCSDALIFVGIVHSNVPALTFGHLSTPSCMRPRILFDFPVSFFFERERLKLPGRSASPSLQRFLGSPVPELLFEIAIELRAMRSLLMPVWKFSFFFPFASNSQSLSFS